MANNGSLVRLVIRANVRAPAVREVNDAVTAAGIYLYSAGYFLKQETLREVNEMKSVIRIVGFAVILASGALVSSVAYAGSCPPGEIEVSGIGGVVCIPIVSVCTLFPNLC